MTTQLIVGMYGFWTLTGDWRRHLQELKKNGATGIRIFMAYGWPIQETIYTPFARLKDMAVVDKYQYIEGRRWRYFKKGDYVMFRKQDRPGVELPVYDLEVMRDEYFEGVNELLKECTELGLTILMEVEDYCSLKLSGVEKYWHPYYVSPQAHSTLTPAGVFGIALKKFMKVYWKRLLDTISPYSGVHVSVMNEYEFKQHNPDGSAMDPAEEKVRMIEWYRDSRLFFAGYPVVASAMRYPKEIAALCNFYSPHGIGDKDSLDFEVKKFRGQGLDITQNTERLILSGDGFSTGSGVPDLKGRRGITTKEVPAIAKMMLNGGYAGYEMLIRNKRGHSRGAHEDFQAMYGGYDVVRAFGERFGTIPPPPKPPEPPPTPPAPPKPPETKRPWWHWLFGKNSIWAKFWKLIRR